MRRGMIYSTILHLAVILFAFLGLPHLMHPPIEFDEPVPVEVVTVGPKTNIPKAEPKPVEPPKKVETPPAPPLPEPPPPVKAETPPPPAPAPPAPPEPAPVVAALPPQPPPQPKVEKKPEPPPEPAEAKPLVPTPPKAKPTPPPQTTVESILKSVEKTKPRSEPDQAEKVVKELAASPKSVTSSLDNKMTVSEVEAVRRQIERYWNVPAGAKDAKNLVIDIHVVMNPDGTVRQATIVDQTRMASDGFFRAAAESAYRAIFLAQPLKLPPDKYSLWQDMTLSFNPSQIL